LGRGGVSGFAGSCLQCVVVYDPDDGVLRHRRVDLRPRLVVDLQCHVQIQRAAGTRPAEYARFGSCTRQTRSVCPTAAAFARRVSIGSGTGTPQCSSANAVSESIAEAAAAVPLGESRTRPGSGAPARGSGQSVVGLAQQDRSCCATPLGRPEPVQVGSRNCRYNRVQIRCKVSDENRAVQFIASVIVLHEWDEGIEVALPVVRRSRRESNQNRTQNDARAMVSLLRCACHAYHLCDVVDEGGRAGSQVRIVLLLACEKSCTPPGLRIY